MSQILFNCSMTLSTARARPKLQRLITFFANLKPRPTLLYRMSPGGSKLLPFTDDGGQSAHWDIQWCRHCFLPFPRSLPQYNPVPEVYRQFLGLHGLVCALTCTRIFRLGLDSEKFIIWILFNVFTHCRTQQKTLLSGLLMLCYTRMRTKRTKHTCASRLYTKFKLHQNGCNREPYKNTTCTGFFKSCCLAAFWIYEIEGKMDNTYTICKVCGSKVKHLRNMFLRFRNRAFHQRWLAACVTVLQTRAMYETHTGANMANIRHSSLSSLAS